MSTTSVKSDFVVRGFSRNYREAGGDVVSDGGAGYREPALLEVLSLASWRKQVLEALVFLAVMTVMPRWLFGVGEVPGLPHPYWLPVLLASCQYGMSGGLIAAVAASVAYWFGVSPPSAAQDFYAYAGTVAVQPAVWLATALVLGGLRNLHIHQSAELADQLAVCRRRANDLSGGLERAVAEINALERRIAVDMSSVAAMSRSLSLIDMCDRPTAAASFGELFGVGTGTATFTIYLKDPAGYVPVWAVEDDSIRSAKSIEPLPPDAVDAMMAENAGHRAAVDVGENEPGAGCHVVRVPPSVVGSDPLAVIICRLRPSQDVKQFRRRADELSRALAAILYACPDSPLGARP